MENWKYYENMGYDGKPPRRNRLVTGLIVIIAVLIVALLVMGLVLSSQNASKTENTEAQANVSPAPDAHQTIPPMATPKAEDREMPDLDGKSLPLTEIYNPIPDLVDAVVDSVVSIDVYEKVVSGGKESLQLRTGGSGFVIASSGYLITNAHVVAHADRVEVVLNNGERYEATIIGADATRDIAVIKINATGLKALKLGDVDQMRVGDIVVAIGSPSNMHQSFEGTVTMGIISAKNRLVNIDGTQNTFVQMDAAINFGSSGGPLFNLQGEVIGITTAKNLFSGFDEYGNPVSTEGMAFAIPISAGTKNNIEQLITVGYVRRPGIGINVLTISEENADTYESVSRGGVYVYGVVIDGPAAQAGLKADDRLVSCQGIAIDDQQILVDMIAERGIGDVLTFVVERAEETLTIDVKIGDRNTLDYTEMKYGAIYNENE